MQNGSRMVHLFRQNLLKSAAKTWISGSPYQPRIGAKAELLFAAADLHISVVKLIYPHVGARNTWGTMSKDVKACLRSQNIPKDPMLTMKRFHGVLAAFHAKVMVTR